MQNFTNNPLMPVTVNEGLLKYCGAINEEIKKQITEQITNSFFYGVITASIIFALAVIVYYKVKK